MYWPPRGTPIPRRCSPPIRATTGRISDSNLPHRRLSLRCAPRLRPSMRALRGRKMADDLLVANGLVVSYAQRRGLFERGRPSAIVLHGVDIRVGKGETVGIVGESGSGKTTLGRALLGLVTPAAGTVLFDGTYVTALDQRARQPFRRRMQMIFQDPMSSLNPRHTIGRILIEPILLHGQAKNHAAALALVYGVLDRVGLSRRTVDRYSYELSGGQ